MRGVMPDAAHQMAYLASQEFAEVDMREDELDTLDTLVETLALGGVEADASARLVPRQREKAGEKRYGGNDEDKVRHGD